MAFSTSPIAGIDFSSTSTTPLFAVGTTVNGDAGSTWTYVKATTALTQYDCAAINSSFEAAPATSALALQGTLAGFPQIAFAINTYGWVPIRGVGLRIRTAASTVKDSKLYVGLSGNSAGVVGSTSGTGTTLLNGVVTVATAASAGVKPAIIATNPWFTP